MIFRPLSTWPGARTPPAGRRSSPFSAGYQATVDLLYAELEHLGAQRVVLELDVPEAGVRRDGRGLLASTQPASPGVVVSFESRHGPLRYACDRFRRWQDNLRAIALGLESLRRVERYGIASAGEQYAGWKALPASTLTFDQARARLRHVLAQAGANEIPTDDRALARRALRLSHPDAGGEPVRFRDVIVPAYQLLTGERAS